MSSYIIIEDNSYDAQDVSYCDSKADLVRKLRAKGYNGNYEWPLHGLEVYQVSQALTMAELTLLREG